MTKLNLILKKYQKPKIITAFNVFAHTPSMTNLVKNIKKILHPEGLFIFEAQYVGDVLKNNILGTFFHEHISHHSVTSLKKLFEIYDLKIIDIKRVKIQKGSILGLVAHKDSLYLKNSSLNYFLNFENKNKINKIKSLKEFHKVVKINKKIANNLIKGYKNLIGYGAARSGPTLLRNFKIENKIDFILDNHQMKVNRFTPSSGIKILHSSNLLKLKPKLIVILAYLHNKKIIKKNLKYIKGGGLFMILYPYPKIINSKNFRKYLNEKSNFALIGLGPVGEFNHLPILLNHRKINLVGICDKDKSKLNIIKKYNLKSYTNFKKMIKDNKIDAVVLSSSLVSLFSISKYILQKKINLFVEKPMCISFNQAKELQMLSIINKVNYMVGYMKIYDPCITKLKNLIIKKI